MVVLRSTASPRREFDAEGDPPPGRRTRTVSAGSAVCAFVRVCGRRAARRCMCVCVWAAGGWLAEIWRWVQVRDDDARSRMTWTLPSFLPCSLFSSTPTHAPAANLSRGRGAE